MKSKHVTRKASSTKHGVSNHLSEQNTASVAASRSDDAQYLNNRRSLFGRLASLIFHNWELEIAARLKAGQYEIAKPQVSFNTPVAPCKKCKEPMQPILAILKKETEVASPEVWTFNVYVCPHCGAYCLHI